jgi:hypothetical protein
MLSLITAAAALLASLISPLVTLSVARRQFRASVISTNRQKWIETLRDRLSELIALINTAQVIKRHSIESWDGGLGQAHGNPGLTKKFERAYKALAEIRLLTSTSDPRHNHLNEALAAAVAHVQHRELREVELMASIEDVVASGRTIIRREWARVKRGA